jgi:hypothetical protein
MLFKTTHVQNWWHLGGRNKMNCEYSHLFGLVHYLCTVYDTSIMVECNIVLKVSEMWWLSWKTKQNKYDTGNQSFPMNDMTTSDTIFPHRQFGVPFTYEILTICFGKKQQFNAVHFGRRVYNKQVNYKTQVNSIKHSIYHYYIPSADLDFTCKGDTKNLVSLLHVKPWIQHPLYWTVPCTFSHLT